MTTSEQRDNNRARRIGKNVGKGIASGILGGFSVLGAVSVSMSDAPKLARIREIDLAVENLLQERDHLVASLLEPGGLEVSENYDPRWRGAETTVALPPGARLTQCKGRSTISKYHAAHPACPYIEQIHTAHEFTLRD